MGKFSQYKQSFREEWKADPMFQNWIESVKEDNLKAYCKHCHVFIPAHYAGITNHASSAKHCKSITKNEKKLLRQSLSLSDSPKKHDGLSKQRSIRKTAKPIESSGEASQEHEDGLCTLELTVDDMTCQPENVRIAQKTYLEACKKIAPETALRLKDSATLGFEIKDLEPTTPAEGNELSRNGKPITSVCDLLHQKLQGSKKGDKASRSLPSSICLDKYKIFALRSRGPLSWNRIPMWIRQLMSLQSYAVGCTQELTGYDHCNVDAVCEKNKVTTHDSLIQEVTRVTSSVNSDGQLSQQTESETTPSTDRLSSEKDTVSQECVPVAALNSGQRYLSSWNSDPMLRDWVAPVPGNAFQAQCRWCRVELCANYKDLKHHLSSVKHSTTALMYNVATKIKVSAQMSSVLGKESTQQANTNSLQQHRLIPGHRGKVVHQLKCSSSNQPNGAGSSLNKSKTPGSKGFVQTAKELDTFSCKQELPEYDDQTKPDCSNTEAYQFGTCGIPAQAVRSATASVDTAEWMSRSETSPVGTDDSATRKLNGNEDDDPMQVKRYPQKYVMRWNSDPVLRDWVAPVAGNVYRARCRWCRVELRAHYKDLKHHAESTKHATSAMMHDGGDFEAKDSAEESSLTDEDSVQPGTWKRLKTSSSAAERKSKQNPCYFLSRSSWDRYKQKYRKAWELDSNFRGWIAPVEGDIFKARCLYCRVLIRAHHKDLKEHSKTTKHATNVGYGLPYNNSQLSDASSVLSKPKMLKRRVIARRKRKQGWTRGLYSVDIGQEDSLLKPDDTLASMESLVNLANMSCLSHPESTVTTLVFPNATQLDESVAAALPNNPKTLYRVKKLSSAVGHIPTKKSKVYEEDSDVQDQVTRLVRKVTLWEFLKMKVERSNGGLRIPEMLSEFESLYDQIKRVTKERLEPVDVDDTSEQPGLKPDAIMVLSSDRLAKLLDMSVGHYRIKERGALLSDGKRFSLNKRADKASTAVSADGSSLISVHSVDNCIPADGLQSSMFSADHVGQPEDVMTTSELVFPTADHIIQLQDTEVCMTPSADNGTQVFTNPDGTFLIHVSGPQRQIPLDVIQYLLAAKEEDSRRLHGTTGGDSTAVLP